MTMAELTLEQIAALMEGNILSGRHGLRFSAYGLDSRLITKGSLFFAIKSTRDGHDFVADAARKGASGAIVSRPVEGVPSSFGMVLVEDTVTALEKLAGAVLSGRRAGVKVIGITGSVGKTTVKEFTAGLIGRRLRVLKSRQNYNNNLGLSLSILELEPEHEAAVLEMGMSAPGEIIKLTRIARPDVAVITNVNPVHLSFFRDLKEIALAKKEILDGAAQGAVAVLNGQDHLLMEVTSAWPGRKILFGKGQGFEVRGENIKYRQDGTLEFTLGFGLDSDRIHLEFLNEAIIENLLAAAGAAMALGLRLNDIMPVISDLRPSARRGEIHRLRGGTILYDDSYNSNPKAIEYALFNLARVPAGRRVAVLADMLELGEQEKDFHKEAGRNLAESGWDILVAVGPLAAFIAEGALESGLKRENVYFFPDSESAAADMDGIVLPGDLVLVKGSRGMKTEIIADTLIRDLGEKE